jgi:hypothetical protein
MLCKDYGYNKAQRNEESINKNGWMAYLEQKCRHECFVLLFLKNTLGGHGCASSGKD